MAGRDAVNDSDPQEVDARTFVNVAVGTSPRAYSSPIPSARTKRASIHLPRTRLPTIGGPMLLRFF